METATTHPLVAKKAAEWVALATKYGVNTTSEPMDGHWSGGVTISFDTNSWMDRACVMIYPPSRKGRTVRQTPLIMGYRKTTGGKVSYRDDPTATLRRMRDRIIWTWSPTAGERLAAEAKAIRAHQERRAEKRHTGDEGHCRCGRPFIWGACAGGHVKPTAEATE